MNRLRLLVSTLILFSAAACGDDDNPGKGSGGSGGEIQYDPAEGFKYVQQLNVQDARMIYRKQSASRADGDDGYWKIDLSGNETKLVLTDSEGKTHDIGINKIVKLSDRFLLIDPNTSQIVDLLVNPGPDDEVLIGLYHYLSIADTRTGKMYKWPRELFRMLGSSYDDWNFTTAADDAQNVYFTLNAPHEMPCIYKLDASAFTIAPVLPEGEPFTDFSVTDRGFVFYWSRYSDSYRVKCPGGAIVPLTGCGFSLGNAVYTYDGQKIFRWETVGDNDLKRTEVCTAETIMDEAPLLTDNLTHSALFLAFSSEAPPEGCFWVSAFDGTAFSAPFPLPNAFRDIDRRNPDFLVTSKAWYLRNGNGLRKLSMQDYADSEIPIHEYEIRQIVANPSKPDLHFTGYRLSDGKEVIGTITDEDEIVIETVADRNRIIDLIAIN